MAATDPIPVKSQTSPRKIDESENDQAKREAQECRLMIEAAKSAMEECSKVNDALPDNFLLFSVVDRLFVVSNILKTTATTIVKEKFRKAGEEDITSTAKSLKELNETFDLFNGLTERLRNISITMESSHTTKTVSEK